LYLTERPPLPPFPIDFFKKNTDGSPVSRGRSAPYAVLCTLASAGAFFGILILIPHVADATWPFFATASADVNQPLIHDSTTPVLAAAINSDPNPNKGGISLAIALDSALIDTSGPDGVFPNASVINTPSQGGTITTYVVKSGDSLSEIAAKFNVSVNTILWANDIKSAKLVKTGDMLIILPVSGIRHQVISGETLSSLAKKYGADANDIAAFNGLGDGQSLSAGDEIIIPGGELSATTGQTTTKTTTTTSTKSTSIGVKTIVKTTTATIKTGGSLSQIQANPYKGGSGKEIDGYYQNPLPGGLITQTIHGWNAVDIAAPNGTPVFAAADGSVIISKMGGWNGGYGNYVVIDHGNGTQTLYSHLSSDLVSVGESVSAGARIGGVGISGEATGYHLHFEVRGARNPFADCAVMTRCTPQ
jgi:murein DD-endopeptidase MepM/ murein hydrolase activator NlpD